MTRNAWIAIGGLSALSLALAAGLAVSLASGDGAEGTNGAPEPAAFAPPGGPQPGGDQLGGPMGAPIGGPPEELEECMSEAGAELPNPGRSPSEKEQEALRDAFEACADELPPGGPSPPGGMMGP